MTNFTGEILSLLTLVNMLVQAKTGCGNVTDCEVRVSRESVLKA